MCSIISFFFFVVSAFAPSRCPFCPQIFDFGVNTSVSFSNTPGSSPRCDRTNILGDDSTAGDLLRPTRDFIERYSASAGAYLNRSHSAATRFIECEAWGSAVTLPLDFGSGSGLAMRQVTTFYAAVAALQGVEYAPVRLESRTDMVNLTTGAFISTIFDIKIDWVDFQFQKPNAALHFTPPPQPAPPARKC